jgi:hypothetical protein
MKAREKVLGAEMKRLLSRGAEHGTSHLTEIEIDLTQTNFLLNEAIEKLGASFLAIHASVRAQQQLVEALMANAGVTADFVDNVKSAQAEIDRHINAAVTGLQFQDMTSQLIGRTVKRINGLRDVLAILGVHSAGMASEYGVEELIAWLDNMNKLLEEQSVRLDSGLWKAVHQTHMESGDIELF